MDLGFNFLFGNILEFIIYALLITFLIKGFFRIFYL